MPNYLAVFNFSTPTGEVLNVVNYSIDNPDPAALQLATAHIQTSWKNNLESHMPAATSFPSITWREDVPNSVPLTVEGVTPPVFGNATTNDYAAMYAVVGRKHNDNGQRPNLGRIYVGGLTAAFLDGDGRWNIAVLANVDGWLESIRAFSTTATPASFQMQIKASNPSAPNTAPYQLVDRFTVRPTPGTQRRRRS